MNSYYMASRLCDDALTNIFSWLPSKQVGQLRCLSKPWNARLSEPVFLKSHLDQALHLDDDKETLFLVFDNKLSFNNNEPFKVITFSSDPRPIMNNNFIKLPANCNIPSYATCTVIGYIDGLICFRHPSYDHQILDVINIWNPCLSKLLVLPNITLGATPPSRYYRSTFFTFGFDPKTDDYKVLTVIFSLDKESTECLLVEVHTYSMRKGSWEVISDKFPSHVTRIYDHVQVCVHGHQDHIHWLGDHEEKTTDRRLTIVAFDFSGETFTEIALPNSIQVSLHNPEIGLGYMAGKICLMSHVGDNECEVWVMDMTTQSSWVKHNNVFLHINNINPDGNLMDSEVIYKVYRNSLALYDPIATKDKPHKIMAIHMGNTKVVRYVESLKWVAPA